MLKRLKGIIRALAPGTSAPKPSTKKSARRSDRSAWAAVSLLPGPKACAQIKKYGGRRWLATQAPRFPLPGCHSKACRCEYAYHADRRAGGRRESDRIERPRGRRYEGTERRAGGRGRRRTD